MSDTEKDAEAKAAETELPTCDTDASEEGAKEDELISLETLRESPVQWPEKFPGLEEFLTKSDTPLYTPNQKFPNSENMTTMQEFASMPPEQLLAKIKSMHDQIYSLGRRESKEMTRGKLLGIFNRKYPSPKK